MRRSSKISLSMRSPEEVIPLLGKPSHWKTGRSAKELAQSWYYAKGFPTPIAALLAQSDTFQDAEFLDGWLERETDLGDSRGTPSQTDMLGLVGTASGLAVLGIEAKVDESFGPIVAEWLTDGSFGKVERLKHLCGLLCVGPASITHLRYQLFHRTTAVILEAKRFRTNAAVLIIQSFCPRKTGLGDAVAFFDAIGLTGLAADKLIGPKRFGDVDLWVGWAADSVWNSFFDQPGAKGFPDRDQPLIADRKL